MIYAAFTSNIAVVCRREQIWDDIWADFEVTL